MCEKTVKVDQFIDGLHDFILSRRQFLKVTGQESEVRIQAEIRPVIMEPNAQHYLTGIADHLGW